MKPRWAVHGVEFLIISSGPTYTQHLNDEEFAAFKVRTSLLGNKIPCTYKVTHLVGYNLPLT